MKPNSPRLTPCPTPGVLAAPDATVAHGGFGRPLRAATSALVALVALVALPLAGWASPQSDPPGARSAAPPAAAAAPRPAAAEPAPPTPPAPAKPAPGTSAATPAIPSPPADSALQIERLKAQLLTNPYDAKVHTQLGILYAQENLLEEARGEFIAAIQAAPAEPSAHLNLGLCLLRMERFDEAATPLAAYNKLAPSSLQGYDLLGQAQAKSGDVASARATWETGLANPNLGPGDRARLTQRIAQLFIDQGKMSEAIGVLRDDEALMKSPDGAPLRESLAFIYLTQAKAARDASDDATAMQMFARARELGTSNAAAYLIPADAMLSEGKVDEAEQLVKQAEPNLPGDPAVPYLKARIAEQRGDLQAAVYNFRETLKRNPQQTGIYPKLGELLALLGDEAGATKALALAGERGEGGPAVSYNLGVVLSKRERYSAAIPHLQAAIAGDSTMQDAYRALASAYRKLDRVAEAADTLQQLVERFGPDPRDLAPLAVCQAKVNRHKQAVETYKLLTAAEPENHAALYNMGLSLAQLSRYNEAAQAFSAALALDPQNESYQFNLGSAYQKAEKYEEAIAAYEKAIELEVTYRSYVNIAICYDKIGFQESRDKYYKLASELKKKGKG